MDMELPDNISDLSDDFREHFEQNSEPLLEDETYCASVFAFCDRACTGTVKVSVLIDYLRELSLADNCSAPENSFLSVGSSAENLEGLRIVLDPTGEDIEISSETFRDGIIRYWREKDKPWAISPVKGHQGVMDQAGFGYPRSSSPRTLGRDKGQRGGRRLFNQSNLSQISDNGRGEQAESSQLEAVGGPSTTAGSDAEGQRELYAKIVDLELKNQQLARDKTFFEQRLRDAEAENTSLNDKIYELKKDHQNQLSSKLLNCKLKLQSEIDSWKTDYYEAKLIDKRKAEIIASIEIEKENLERELLDQRRNLKEVIDANLQLKNKLAENMDVIMKKDITIAAMNVDFSLLKAQAEEKHGLLALIEAYKEKELYWEEERNELVNKITELRNRVDKTNENEISFDEPDDSQTLDLETRNILEDECMRCAILSDMVERLSEILHLAKTIRDAYNRTMALYRKESAPCDPCPTDAVAISPRINGSNGTHPMTSSEEQHMTNVVREIQEELLDFRNELKKSQELLNFINIKSSQQSLALTKSCPGLAMNLNGLNGGGDTTKKSIGIQTEKAEVETPVLAQKLSQISSFPSDSTESHNSFDNRSDDGSVRGRDDLSTVDEYPELEIGGNSADPSADKMNSERGNSIGGSRPKLVRKPNVPEDDDHTDKNREREDDIVSVTSSQGESVYLSLERPLKVTVSGKGEEDRSSSHTYRSCNSSLILGGSLGRGRIPHVDSDTASVVSEGNTTFGSPFSSPSSPYWTPSQGSSSQETLTPLGNSGDRTPVNIEEDERLYSPSGGRSDSASFHSPMGRIPDEQLPDTFRLMNDTVSRAVRDGGKLLSNQDWRKVRSDHDRNDRERYNHHFAQENEDAEGTDGAGGVVAAINSHYAFRHDEDAEATLEVFPNIVERLIECLDVIRDSNGSLTQEVQQDLDMKFNHMAEVYKTEHIDMEHRMNLLANSLKSGQKCLKDMSDSLKNCVSKLEDTLREDGPSGIVEVLPDTVKSLRNLSLEFDLYSNQACRDARTMGRMDATNRFHRMMEVVILYVNILKARDDQHNERYGHLLDELKKATDLLKENNLSFPGMDGAIESHPTNNNENKALLSVLDASDIENDEGGNAGMGGIFDLLSFSLRNNKRLAIEGSTPVETHSTNPIRCFFTELWNIFKWDFFWPYNASSTMNGLTRSAALFLIIVAILNFFWGSAFAEPHCERTGSRIPLFLIYPDPSKLPVN